VFGDTLLGEIIRGVTEERDRLGTAKPVDLSGEGLYFGPVPGDLRTEKCSQDIEEPIMVQGQR
jgi:hypothetical protein